MDIGEQLTILEEHIYAFAENQFETNGITPSFQRMIMEGVYSKFQSKALRRALFNQVSYKKDNDISDNNDSADNSEGGDK